jgi:hypothetical protein
MEIRRLSNLRKFKKRDGWIVLSRETFEAVGLLDRQHRSQVVRRLVSWGWLETRGEKGQGLEYRVPPDWAKAKPEVIELALKQAG